MLWNCMLHSELHASASCKDCRTERVEKTLPCKPADLESPGIDTPSHVAQMMHM